MSEIDIRELEAKASKIIDEVREHGARYTITRRGRAVAVLLPVQDAPGESASGEKASSDEDAWRKLELLGEEIGRGWRRGEASGDVLTRMRR